MPRDEDLRKPLGQLAHYMHQNNVMGGTPNFKRDWDAVRPSTAVQYRNPNPARNQPRGSTGSRIATTLSTITNTARSSIAQTRRSAQQDQRPENTRSDIPSKASSTERLLHTDDPIPISVLKRSVRSDMTIHLTGPGFLQSDRHRSMPRAAFQIIIWLVYRYL
ncbi:hypothetical protein K440DRAFT_680134 [Wilcoxina mikolae CBS 423.85]|nr:hypothetical protein K440DRAFT_680134 [Wilcoxina mikolae CBS 423.85]